ncbi:MAG: N-acetylmuramoyl-L-alanine amidase [Intestinibacillus sp.]
MAKVLIGVGQDAKNSEAPTGGLAEMDLPLSVALYCKAELVRHGVSVQIAREGGGEDCMLEEIRACNVYSPDAAIAIHICCNGRSGFAIYHTRYGGVGKTLAKNVEEEVKKIGQNSHGLKICVNDEGRDDFAFIRGTKCPAVVLEAGFPDAEDRELLGEPGEQRRFGMACAKGILRTLGITWRPDNDSTVKNSMDIILEKTGIEQHAVDYLLEYPHGKELVIKLAAAME